MRRRCRARALPRRPAHRCRRSAPDGIRMRLLFCSAIAGEARQQCVVAEGAGRRHDHAGRGGERQPAPTCRWRRGRRPRPRDPGFKAARSDGAARNGTPAGMRPRSTGSSLVATPGDVDRGAALFQEIGDAAVDRAKADKDDTEIAVHSVSTLQLQSVQAVVSCAEGSCQCDPATSSTAPRDNCGCAR